MRTRRLHARLAYVKRADNRVLVALKVHPATIAGNPNARGRMSVRVDNHAKVHPAILASNPIALGKKTARFSRARSAWTV